MIRWAWKICIGVIQNIPIKSRERVLRRNYLTFSSERDLPPFQINSAEFRRHYVVTSKHHCFFHVYWLTSFRAARQDQTATSCKTFTLISVGLDPATKPYNQESSYKCRGKYYNVKIQLRLILHAATAQIFSKKKGKERNLLCKSYSIRVSENTKK